MTWSIGSVVFDVADEPDEGAIQRIAPHRWVSAQPRGAPGELLQYIGKGNRRHSFHFFLNEDVVADLEAVYNSHAAGGGPDTFICPRPPFDVGVPVIMTEFSAVWDSSVRGEEHWYSCTILLWERNP